MMDDILKVSQPESPKISSDNLPSTSMAIKLNITAWDYWDFWLFPSSSILKNTQEHNVLKTGCFLSQVRGCEALTTYSVGSVKGS
jgi:hypothetical protein